MWHSTWKFYFPFFSLQQWWGRRAQQVDDEAKYTRISYVPKEEV
jgi:hypothetical protein